MPNNLISINTSFIDAADFTNIGIFSAIEWPLSSIMEKIQNEVNNKVFSEHLEPILKQEAKIFFDNGWWFVLNLPDDFLYDELNGLTITPETLTDEIVKYCNKDNCKELDAIVTGWYLEPFSDNEEIFQDALWAHKASKFTLTVPALTIQVEGVIRSYLNYIEKHSIHSYKDELKKRYKDSILPDQGFISFIQMQNLEFLENNLESLYKSFNPSTPTDYDDLYRNPMFHGQYQNYHSIEISTKIFLFLDMLHHILEDLEEYSNRS